MDRNKLNGDLASSSFACCCDHPISWIARWSNARLPEGFFVVRVNSEFGDRPDRSEFLKDWDQKQNTFNNRTRRHRFHSIICFETRHDAHTVWRQRRSRGKTLVKQVLTSSSLLVLEARTCTRGGMPPHSRIAVWFSTSPASSLRACMATAAASDVFAGLLVVELNLWEPTDLAGEKPCT